MLQVDVYSYDPSEDGMVKDPLLQQHLEHFGIDIARTSKTDKTLAEMELDANAALDFSRLTAAGKSLKLVYGPGFTGIHNLGNTCYLASLMQASEGDASRPPPPPLFSAAAFFPPSPPMCVCMQALVGRGHPEFSTTRQQDVFELYQYLFGLLQAAGRRGGADPSRPFCFEVEERKQCAVSGKVSRRLRWALDGMTGC